MFTLCLVNEVAMYCDGMAEIFLGRAVLGKLTVIYFEGKGRGKLKSHSLSLLFYFAQM